jgi:hypothetical protein
VLVVAFRLTKEAIVMRVKAYADKGIIEIDGRYYWLVVKQPIAHEKVEWFLEELTQDEIKEQNLKKKV